MFVSFIIWLLFIPRAPERTLECDVIEKNTVMQTVTEFGTPKSKPRLTQVIYWQYQQSGTRVVAWRKVTDERPSQIVWKDGFCFDCFTHGGVQFQVKASKYRETETSHDPEIADRVYLPLNKRPKWFDARSYR